MKGLSSIIGLLFFSGFAQAQYGVLDPSFGTGGFVTDVYSPDPGNSFVQDISVLPNGHILTMGRFIEVGSSRLALNRMGPDGTLDPSFGSGGVALHAFDTLHTEYWQKMIVQPDGKILAGGRIYVDDKHIIQLARLNADGSLDGSFGTNGQVVFPIDADSSQFFGGFKLQADGKIVVVGSFEDLRKGVLARLNMDGTFDSTFGTEGIVLLDARNGVENLKDVTVRSDGMILTVGYVFDFGGDISVVFRVDPNGVPDPTFDGDGLAEIAIGPNTSEGHLIRILPSGSILVAGMEQDTDHPMLFQLNSDGSMDDTYGTSGVTLFSDVATTSITDMHIQPDGKALVCGNMWNGTLGEAMMLLRTNVDGSSDATFGNNGVVMTQTGSPAGMEIMEGIDIAPDNELIACGRMGTSFTQEAVQVVLKYGPGPISIEELELPVASVHPNPASDHLTLTFKDPADLVQLELTTVDGRRVHIWPLQAGLYHGAQRLQLPTSISEGMYLLRIGTEKGYQVETLIIGN